MNLDNLLSTLERHKFDGGPTENLLVACLTKNADVWRNWDTTEALEILYLYIHDDTEPDTVTQEQHDAIEEIDKLAGIIALKILATALRRMS